MNKPILFIFAVFILLTGCKGFLGEKTDLSFIEPPVKGNQESEVYIPILPPLTGEGMLEPTDIVSGYDQLIYVADQRSGNIFCFDQAGRQLSRFALPGVKAVAQDLRLNILAIADFDTVIGDRSLKLPAVYRLNLDVPAGYSLRNAQIIKKMVYPFYFKSSVSDADLQVRLNDIAVYADNSYLVTRTGNRNNATQFGGPDDAVTTFNADDRFTGVISVRTATGSLTNYFNKPVSITTVVQPPIPPSTTVSRSKNFFISMIDGGVTLKVQAINAVTGENGLEYVLNTALESGDTAKGDGFLYAANRFNSPLGLAYQFDAAEHLFVVDAEKDSVYQFTRTGLEGVAPLPGATRRKPIIVSFGGKGTGPKQFNRPVSVASVGRTLYVGDAGNGRILRYRLSRDME